MPDPEFKINWEWEAAPSVRAAEHRATWARIEIRVGDEWATLVEDRDSGSARHSLYCPLYPFAEWVAYNWWFLQADARPAGLLARLADMGAGDLRNLPRSLSERHSIRASGDGFAWPDLWIVPDGSSTRLVWQDDRAPQRGWPVRFLARGEHRVDSEDVDLELSRLVSSVLTRLAEQGVTGTALEKEWAAIGETDAEEADYCKAAARLGLDPYSMPEEYESMILRAADYLPPQVLGDFLDAADPAYMATSLDWVEGARGAVTKGPERAADLAELLEGSLASLKRDMSEPNAANQHRLPWQLGEYAARVFRDSLGIDPLSPFSVESYLSSTVREAPDRSFNALGIKDRKSGPVAVLGRPSHPAAVRFTLARSLWRYIWDDDPFFLVTTAYTDRQKTERAFAAELLAPAAGIAELLPVQPREASEEDLDELASRYDVQPMVVSHQVRNHLIAAEES